MASYCKNCKKLFYEEPDQNCPNCGIPLSSVPFTNKMWDKMDDSTKTILKEAIDNGNEDEVKRIINEKCDSKDEGMESMLKHIKRIDHDLHFFYTLALISIILGFFALFIILFTKCM